MKKTFLLLILTLVSYGMNAQLVISNGEDIGINWWQAGSTAVEYVDWHPKDGNPSAKCMTIWISTNSDPWSGGGMSNLNIDVTTYNKISVLVYKNVSGTVRLELQDGTTNYFTSANYTTPGAWQKLEFTIPTEMTNNITTLLIAPFIDYDLLTIVGEQSRCFWDDVIAYSETSTGLEDVVSQNAVPVRSEVYSISGALVKSFDARNESENLGLSKGIYLLKQIYKDGNSSVSKIIINKSL